MLTKAEALRRARKLGAPKPGVTMKISPIEVGLAWMELHGLGSAKTARGNPMWTGDVLVLRRGEKPVPYPPPSVSEVEFNGA